MEYFGIFSELLSTQNVNVARFARNVEWDFFCDFQTLCLLYLDWPISDTKFWPEFFLTQNFDRSI